MQSYETPRLPLSTCPAQQTRHRRTARAPQRLPRHECNTAARVHVWPTITHVARAGPSPGVQEQACTCTRCEAAAHVNCANASTVTTTCRDNGHRRTFTRFAGREARITCLTSASSRTARQRAGAPPPRTPTSSPLINHGSTRRHTQARGRLRRMRGARRHIHHPRYTSEEAHASAPPAAGATRRRAPRS
jgi:hypothetical protein